MRGILEHFKLTLALNFKNRQALIYGYMVPFFFLIAFPYVALVTCRNEIGWIMCPSVGICSNMVNRGCKFV